MAFVHRLEASAHDNALYGVLSPNRRKFQTSTLPLCKQTQLRSTIAQVNGKKELTGRTDLDVAVSNHCGRLRKRRDRLQLHAVVGAAGPDFDSGQ